MAIERQDINKKSPWWGEHVYRYQTAAKYLKPGNNVLDIACGNGYGTSLLRELADCNVTGADISEETIFLCRKHFETNGIKFEVLNATQLSYDNETFDAIVSFETIEHSMDYTQIVAELSRVAKRNATILISTPNTKIVSPKGIVENPFHLKEFTYDELHKLLSSIFPDFKIYGQKYNRYSKRTIRNKVAFFAEKLLLKRGIRKLPITMRDKLMKWLIGKPLYAEPVDFLLTESKHEAEKCTTFFAICKKN